MPYIPSDERAAVEEEGPVTPGELNYAITKMVSDFLYCDPDYSPAYEDYNEVIGILECVKLEVYRRLVGPYEDVKRMANGDVFP